MTNILQKDLLLTRETVQEHVIRLAGQISHDYAGQEPILIGLLKGATIFLADLIRRISIPVKIDFIRAASYGSDMESSRTIRLTKDVEIPIQGKPILLVDDIVDTGLTLTHIIKEIEAKGPASIKVCALIDKYGRREVDIMVDYWGFRIDEGFIVGYGLDYDEEYRQLPDIYVLR